MVRVTKKKKQQLRKKLLVGAYLLSVLIIISLIFIVQSEKQNVLNKKQQIESLQSLTGIGDYGSAHNHADFAVFVHSKQIDFTGDDFLDGHPLIHLHSGKNNDQVIHSHATGLTYGMFFSTIGITVGDCFELSLTEFCDDSSNTLSYYVNGKIVPNLNHVEIQDLDKVLITYGSDHSELKKQLETIGTNSCTQSGTCE